MTITDTNGRLVKVNSREGIEKVFMIENESRF